MSWFSGPVSKTLRERLDIEIAKGLNDVKLDTDLEMTDLDDIFDSLGETFDSLVDDSSQGYHGGDIGYTGASEREAQRDKIRRELASDRERMKVEMRANKSRMKAESQRLKIEMKEMKKRLKKSLPRGTVNIQSGGSNNISISSGDNISISTINGNTSVKVGNVAEKHFIHKTRLYEPNTNCNTHVTYYDADNFRVTNDESSPSFNLNDTSLRQIKSAIRADIKHHEKQAGNEIIDRIKRRGKEPKGPPNYIEGERPPPPKPMMPPNESFKEHELHNPYIPIETKQSYEAEPIFLARNWKGDRGEPIEFDEDAKVTMTGRSMFGRKYEVKIDGTAIHVPTIESHMKFCFEGDHLSYFSEMRKRPGEKAIFLKIINGLIAMDIAEPHHMAIKQVL
jgi:hypothetical protein